MRILRNFFLYLGTPGWGWIMYGIGWKTKWFFGMSVQVADHDEKTITGADSVPGS